MSTVNSNSSSPPGAPGNSPGLKQELWRRAGNHFTRAGRWREGADALLAAGRREAAARALARAGDTARLTRLLLSLGNFAGARESSAAWLTELAAEPARRQREEVAARLARAAALQLSGSLKQARRHYLAARRRLARKPAPDPAQQAEEWEALGRYGALVKRPDLVRLGYEKALAAYGQTFNFKRLSCAGRYLEQVTDDPVLVRDIEERMASWQPRSALRREREKLFAALENFSAPGAKNSFSPEVFKKP